MTRRARTRFALIAILPVLAAGAAQDPAPPSNPNVRSLAESGWDPASSASLTVGILEWRDSAYEPFPADGRQDVLLHRWFLERGIPEEAASILLDADASSAAVLSELTRVARGAKDSLFLYYAGHGVLLPDAGTAFVPYDASSSAPEDELLTVTKLARVLETHFRGKRVFLFGDACHSGGLLEAAMRLNAAGIPTIVLASAKAAEESTGNWTFTESLLAALGDANPSPACLGEENLAALASLVRERMRRIEGQEIEFRTSRVGPDFRLGPTCRDPIQASSPHFGFQTERRLPRSIIASD